MRDNVPGGEDTCKGPEVEIGANQVRRSTKVTMRPVTQVGTDNWQPLWPNSTVDSILRATGC